jgi:hypothetical protein
VRQRVLDTLQTISELQSGAPDRATYDANMVVQRFVAYQLLVLGEAAYKMPAEARQRYPESLGIRSPVCDTSWCTATIACSLTSSGVWWKGICRACEPSLRGCCERSVRSNPYRRAEILRTQEALCAA